MKSLSVLLTVFLSLMTTAVIAHTKTDTVKVYGNCDMCKNRIEKALKTEGVSKADWNVDTKVLTVTYDTHKTNLDDIQKKIAAAGHDTQNFAADQGTYDKLPECCKYERKTKDAAAKIN